MNKEEIFSMPVGRELDALVAEKVMGWETSISWGGLYWNDHIVAVHEKSRWKPSKDISAAWEVVEKIMSKYRYRVDVISDGRYSVNIMTYHGCLAEAHAETAPEAICKSALLAVME